MRTMKMIDLLVKIANKEIKEHTFFKRIEVYQSVNGNEVDKYEYVGNDSFYVHFKDKSKKPINYNLILNICLNDQVEIIEESPKKIEIDENMYDVKILSLSYDNFVSLNDYIELKNAYQRKDKAIYECIKKYEERIAFCENELQGHSSTSKKCQNTLEIYKEFIEKLKEIRSYNEIN